MARHGIHRRSTTIIECRTTRSQTVRTDRVKRTDCIHIHTGAGRYRVSSATLSRRSDRRRTTPARLLGCLPLATDEAPLRRAVVRDRGLGDGGDERRDAVRQRVQSVDVFGTHATAGVVEAGPIGGRTDGRQNVRRRRARVPRSGSDGRASVRTSHRRTPRRWRRTSSTDPDPFGTKHP